MPHDRLNGHAAGFSRAKPPPDPTRLPPCNLDAERGVIGSILLDNACGFDAFALLAPEDFYRDAHQAVYRIVRDRCLAGKPIDTLILAEELQRLGVYDSLGGDDLITALVESVPHTAHVDHYSAIVAEKATLRKLIEGGNAILRAAYDNNRAADDVLAEAERTVYDIGSRSLNSEVAPIGDCLDDVLDGIASRIDGPGEGRPTGLAELDSFTHGFRAGEVTVLAARPAMGKTSLALDLADRVASGCDDGRSGVLFLSLEMGRRELAERLLAQKARVDGDDIKAGGDKTLRAMEQIERSGARHHVARLPLLLDDVPTRTVAQIGAIVRRSAARSPVRLVVVDYLQLIQVDKDARRNLNREQQVAEISRTLKVIARECRVPVLLLAQLNREVEKRGDQRPLLSDLRESGAVEQDADVVLMLYREAYSDPGTPNKNVCEVLVRKNRHGRSGTARVFFDPKCGRWDNLDTRHADGPF